MNVFETQMSNIGHLIIFYNNTAKKPNEFTNKLLNLSKIKQKNLS